MEDDIEVGDLVECIKLRDGKLNYVDFGRGFESGLSFIVQRVHKYNDGEVVYFGGLNGNGVYGSYVKKISRGKFKLKNRD
jgi:hypothetical protein